MRTYLFQFFVIIGLLLESGCSNKGGTDLLNDEQRSDSLDSQLSMRWPEGKYISVDEVYRLLQANVQEMLLLNVSDEEFYYLGHIPHSLVIPWDQLEAHLDLVSPSYHIVIYCRRGIRSLSAYETLKNHSYPYIWIMEGGLEAWIEKGYPTVTCEDPTVTCL